MRSIISKTGGGGRLLLLFVILMLVVWCITLTCCMALPTGPPIEEYSSLHDGDKIFLPAPVTKGTTSLEEALYTRRSEREYTPEPLSLADISQLLWAGQGISDPPGLRTAPSAGALYPLELFLAVGDVQGLSKGVYQYQPGDHSLVRRGRDDIRGRLYEKSLHQSSVRDAPAVIIITADYSRTEQRYRDRAVRYVHMEAGHASQNIYLQATTLGVGTVAIGAFDDAGIHEVLSLPETLKPLYLMPMGKRYK